MFIPAIAVMAVALALGFFPDGHALVGILDEQCGLKKTDPADIRKPCLRVERDPGYAVIRDRKGSHHFLLLPTEPISGIESPVLLDPSTPNYFWLAWQSRDLITDALPGIEDADVMLAVNSRYGRSQSRLHIHISCTKPEVRARLDRLVGDSGRWRPISGGLLSDIYWVLKVQPDELREKGAFRLLAERFPVRPQEMGTYSLAQTMSRDGDFLLLATKVSITDLNFASSGQLLDHSCTSGRQLQSTAD